MPALFDHGHAPSLDGVPDLEEPIATSKRLFVRHGTSIHFYKYGLGAPVVALGAHVPNDEFFVGLITPGTDWSPQQDRIP